MKYLALLAYKLTNKIKKIAFTIKSKWNQFIYEGQLLSCGVDYRTVCFAGRPILQISPKSKVVFGERVVINSGSEQNGVIGNRYKSVIKVARGGGGYLLIIRQVCLMWPFIAANQ